jgi:estrogen-related receptor beta like 1
MHQHREGIETSLTETRVHLDKLHDEISHTLEKIGSREKYLNNQLEHLLTDFRYVSNSKNVETKTLHPENDFQWLIESPSR